MPCLSLQKLLEDNRLPCEDRCLTRIMLHQAMDINMPARTVKARADKKRIVMPEPTTEKPKKAGVLKIPVHISEGPQRLPNNEASYLHKARDVSAPLTKMQVYAITAFRRGVGLAEIAKSSGLPSITLIKTLKTVGLSEEIHKLELESLANYYENRRNP